MTSQGSALMRFERAVRIGNPDLVIAAAHELPKPIQLRDALRVVLVLATTGAEQFRSAAVRFGVRLVSERRLALEDAQLLFAALASLSRAQPAAGGEALCTLLELHGEGDAARYVQEWLATRA